MDSFNFSWLPCPHFSLLLLVFTVISYAESAIAATVGALSLSLSPCRSLSGPCTHTLFLSLMLFCLSCWLWPVFVSPVVVVVLLVFVVQCWLCTSPTQMQFVWKVVYLQKHFAIWRQITGRAPHPVTSVTAPGCKGEKQSAKENAQIPAKHAFLCL